MHVRAACLAVICAAAPSAVVADGPVVLERYGDPYLPRDEGPGGPEGGPVVFGDFVHHQVNVDANGNNIANDAANEPSIAVDPTAPLRMAIGWRQFDTTASNFRQAGYSFTDDGGLTWAEQNVIEPGLFRSDPVLASGPDGTFYYLSLRVTQQNEFFSTMFISSDGGQTWPFDSFAFGGDKQWLAIDATGGQGDGHHYQAWNIGGNQYFPDTFNRSPDGGVTWEDPVQYDPGNDFDVPVFGQNAVAPDGAVYVAGARNSSSTDLFWVVRSTNAKNSAVTPTFDQITDIDMGGDLTIGTGPNPAGLLGQVNIAIDHSGGPGDGDIYVLASVNPPGPDPMDVHIIRSQDDGASFSAPVKINDDAGNNWQWFGTMSIAPNGRLDVVWNDTRNSGQENLNQLFYSFSTDGGQSWSANVPVSPEFNSFLGWPQQNKLGDYYDMVSDQVGASLAWAATFNGEQDVYFVRINDYDCNDNGVGDAQDIAEKTSADCNANGIPDECEIAAGTAADADGNGVIDECETPGCLWDCVGGDGEIGIDEFLAVLGSWGEVGAPCDFDGNGVGINDFLKVLGLWGPCP